MSDETSKLKERIKELEERLKAYEDGKTVCFAVGDWAGLEDCFSEEEIIDALHEKGAFTISDVVPFKTAPVKYMFVDDEGECFDFSSFKEAEKYLRTRLYPLPQQKEEEND